MYHPNFVVYLKPLESFIVVTHCTHLPCCVAMRVECWWKEVEVWLRWVEQWLKEWNSGGSGWNSGGSE